MSAAGALGAPAGVQADRITNVATSMDWSFSILAPVGLEYCQDFSGGLNDFTEARDIAGGNTWSAGEAAAAT